MAKADLTAHVFAGKGGVGKSSLSASLALHLAKRNFKTALIDYDGGHSIQSVLGLEQELAPNRLIEIDRRLAAAVIETTPYTTITQAKELGWDLEQYLHQFPGQAGIVPFADMGSEFFGMPTDVPSLQKFASLVEIVGILSQRGYTRVVIDMEPTAGLERLLKTASSMVRSLKNLKASRVSLLAIAAKWPDIRGYLNSEYIRLIAMYADGIADTTALLRGASYLLVCTPERGPVGQTEQVARIVASFGGIVRGCVVNNVRQEPHEQAALAMLGPEMHLALIRHDERLHSSADRSAALAGIGKQIAEAFW